MQDDFDFNNLFGGGENFMKMMLPDEEFNMHLDELVERVKNEINGGNVNFIPPQIVVGFIAPSPDPERPVAIQKVVRPLGDMPDEEVLNDAYFQQLGMEFVSAENAGAPVFILAIRPVLYSPLKIEKVDGEELIVPGPLNPEKGFLVTGYTIDERQNSALIGVSTLPNGSLSLGEVHVSHVGAGKMDGDTSLEKAFLSGVRIGILNNSLAGDGLGGDRNSPIGQMVRMMAREQMFGEGAIEAEQELRAGLIDVMTLRCN